MNNIVKYEDALKLKAIGYPQYDNYTREYATYKGVWVSLFEGEPDYKVGELIPMLHGIPTDGSTIAAPTFSQVFDWLREKEIFINVIYSDVYKRPWKWQVFAKNYNTSRYDARCRFDTFEIAAENAMQFAISLLN